MGGTLLNMSVTVAQRDNTVQHRPQPWGYAPTNGHILTFRTFSNVVEELTAVFCLTANLPSNQG